MTDHRRLDRFTTWLTINGVDLEISGFRRSGARTPLVFLHGFGSTKEDYADVAQRADLAEHAILAYDAPGCGTSRTHRPSATSIPFLAALASKMIADLGRDRVILVGHSMGGLTALRYATAHPRRIAGLVNIEGNLAPEDCFLSRQIVEHPRHTPQQFFEDFRSRVAASRYAGSALYAAGLPAKVSPEVVAPIFTSMVSLSDEHPLLEDFRQLSAPRMFMYGEQNNSLSYLQSLRGGGVQLCEIAHSAHFPMYSNAPDMWTAISQFVHAADSPLEQPVS